MAESTTTPPEEPPEIWRYRDARRFLGDLCAFKAAVDADFSYRQLSRFAELGSPNYVQMFLRGRRNLKPSTARRIAAAIGLDEQEVRFFAVLTQFTQSANPEERAGWYEELLRLAVRYGGTGRIDAAKLAYFTHWYIPVIHAMASLKGFRPDPHWVAARIVPRIRPYDAKRALGILFELEIFEENEDGFEVHEPRLETEEGLRGVWLREYHRAMIRLSEQALDMWPPEERTTSALTVTVPHELVAKLLERVDEHRRELFEWLMAEQEGVEGVDGEVMQVNLQAFRLTDVREEG